MGAEVLLYAYGLVCLSMLVFNLIYGLYLRTDDRRRQRRIGRLRRRMEFIGIICHSNPPAARSSRSLSGI